MTPSPPIAKLTKPQQQQLLDDLNYLNTAEIKTFCKRHSLPYTIAIETKDGRRKKTHEDDRKGVMLERARIFLKTGKVVEETCFPASVVRLEAVKARPTPDHRLLYGQYDKTNHSMFALLRKLTNGKFRDGAIARILLREFWSKGQAPTFKDYAAAWTQAVQVHTQPNAEWAFLADRARGTAGENWKKLRAQKAARVIKTLKQITESPNSPR